MGRAREVVVVVAVVLAVLPVGQAQNPRLVGTVGRGCGGEPWGACPGPLPILYIALATGAHQSQTNWSPRSGAEGESGPIFGSGLEINSNILPLDLFLFLILVLHLNHSITDQCIGRASS